MTEWCFKEEARWSTAVAFASGFAILIACMGLLALTIIAVRVRTREIGIRRVLGATALRILLMLSREFACLVAAGSVLAWPVAYLVTSQWLQQFAYRVEPNPWMFGAAGLGTLAASVLTILALAGRAAAVRPVQALRYE